MKAQKWKELLSRQCGRNHALSFVVTASLAIGILAGMLSAVNLNGTAFEDTKNYLQQFFSAYGLQSIDKNEILSVSLYQNFKLLIFLWISGLSIFFFPFTLLQVGLKGYKFAFSIAFFARVYRWKGIGFGLVSVLPQNLLVIPMLILYGTFLIRNAGKLYQLRGVKNARLERKRIYLSNLKFLMIASVLFIAGSFMEAYLVPVFVRPICNFM